MDYHGIYDTPVPAFLTQLADAAPLRRLRQVGMNCGCEYTSFPRFAGLERYTRWEHSLGAALIVWRFTRDEAQSVSALLHDVATPPFAHVVDFLHGDHLRQTATEGGTAAVIRASGELCALLAELGLRAGDVEDYHRYPIADNDTPRLSADRLDYTLGNALNFGFAQRDELGELFADIRPGVNERGETELVFRSAEKAARFAALALQCSRVYVCDEDRYAMQILAEMLGDALCAGVLREADLALTEEHVIEKLSADELFAARWRAFRSLKATERADAPDGRGGWRKIFAKRRWIDPYVENLGRVSALDGALGTAMKDYLADEPDYYVRGE